MLHADRHIGPLPTIALCALLIAAHFAAALHNVEHDIAGPSGKVCATCVTAAQLGSACVDSETAVELDRPGGFFEFAANTDFRSIPVFAVRQRGPPAPLTVQV